MKTLLAMHTYKRPHYSKSEEEFLDLFFRPFEPIEDAFGNLYFEVNGGGDVLFCAHSDTVHRGEGRQKPRRKGDLLLAPKGDVLGADDGAGLWMIYQILKSDIPCHCVITRGEEVGGLGAKYILENNLEWLSQFKKAVAFDRRGVSSVITHQWSGRCCSDIFAESLATALNEQLEDGFFLPDDTGVFTDTAIWVDVIPEGTNISVGYSFEHSENESLDTKFLKELRDAVLRVDWAALPVERDPLEIEYKPQTWGNYRRSEVTEPYDAGDLAEMKYADVVKWVEKTDPREVAELLLDLADKIIYPEPSAEKYEDRLAAGMW